MNEAVNESDGTEEHGPYVITTSWDPWVWVTWTVEGEEDET